MDDGQLERDLAAAVDGEVRFDAGTRGAYSTDASNFRQVPLGVVLPRTVDAAEAAVSVCRGHGVPVLSRGGGTSLAGQCTNTAVVIDWSKYCHRVTDIDAAARTCTVEPGDRPRRAQQRAPQAVQTAVRPRKGRWSSSATPASTRRRTQSRASCGASASQSPSRASTTASSPTSTSST
jgi:FAD/FMN-containing dehydrogenase